MSRTLEQIFIDNPITTNQGTDLMYFAQDPYTAGNDAGMTFTDFASQFGSPFTPSALTRTNDTNVTVTLGGTPSTALLEDTSLTLGWTGQLSVPRGGTGNSTFTAYSVICAGTTATGVFQNVVGVGTAGEQLTSNGPGLLPTWQPSSTVTPAALTRVDDTNVTITLGGTPTTALLQATSLTMGWSGQLSPDRGGTGVNNGTSTLTLAGNLATSGAFASTFTMTGATGVTFPTSGTLATTSQLPTPAALTKVDDTNVTLALGGTPTTALLQATSLTLGWTGTLSGTRGGTGANNGTSTFTMGGSVTFSGAFTFDGTLTGNTAVTFPTSGTLATTSQLVTPAALTKTDDTNVTLTLGGSPTTALVNAASLTLGWTGQLALTRGGTNNSLTASAGGIVWSDASKLNILSGTVTANQILLSGNAVTPAWSTTTYPATNAINTIMYASSANVLGVITPVNSAVLISSSGGVPSMSTTLPSGIAATNMNLTTPTLGAATATSLAFSPTTGGIVGTTAANNADSGKVGEFLTNSATGVSMTTTALVDIVTLSLSAGDWDVWANLDIADTVITMTTVAGWTSLSSATLPAASLRSTLVTGATGALNEYGFVVPLARYNVSTTTTIYLSASATFATGTVTGTGVIYARRVR